MLQVGARASPPPPNLLSDDDDVFYEIARCSYFYYWAKSLPFFEHCFNIVVIRRREETYNDHPHVNVFFSC